MRLTDFDETMAEHLRDPEYAAALLAECLSGEDGTATFLRALKAVVQAQANISDVAREMHASRTSLYRTLSENGNPEIKTLVGLLDAVGLQLSVTPKQKAA